MPTIDRKHPQTTPAAAAPGRSRCAFDATRALEARARS